MIDLMVSLVVSSVCWGLAAWVHRVNPKGRR
jgi:uncharacterized membrane protein (GlpM family)